MNLRASFEEVNSRQSSKIQVIEVEEKMELEVEEPCLLNVKNDDVSSISAMTNAMEEVITRFFEVENITSANRSIFNGPWEKIVPPRFEVVEVEGREFLVSTDSQAQLRHVVAIVAPLIAGIKTSIDIPRIVPTVSYDNQRYEMLGITDEEIFQIGTLYPHLEIIRYALKTPCSKECITIKVKE